MSQIRAKKSLGQHFLIDRNIAYRIVKALDPQSNENVVEIGSGKGALTAVMVKKGCRVTAIEFDSELIPVLEHKFSDMSNFTLLAKDFLAVTSADLPSRFKLIGNIPYNITTVILEKLFEFKKAVSNAVFTVQSEVADRLTASPGTRANGSFTIIMQAGFDIKAMFRVHPRAFKPVPAVGSTVIKLKPVSREPEGFENFKTFVRGCFRQKRKTLNNSMQLGLNLPKKECESMIEQIGKQDNIRSEQLSFDDYLNLYKLWCDLR